MFGAVRSINLANAVSIVAYEFLRQMRAKNIMNELNAVQTERTFYKKKTPGSRRTPGSIQQGRRVEFLYCVFGFLWVKVSQ